MSSMLSDMVVKQPECVADVHVGYDMYAHILLIRKICGTSGSSSPHLHSVFNVLVQTYDSRCRYICQA